MRNNMMNTWRDAFLASPGPDSIRKAVVLGLKGICMGSADVIPGVSGGTIALITGIYENLIAAIRSIDLSAAQKLLRCNLKEALAHVHLRFLLCLFFGIGLAIISLARLMNYLLHAHPIEIWSLFFGLIAASILVVGKQVSDWIGPAGICFVAGAIVAAVIVSLIPVTTPETLWFILLCGVVAICAMILPGISGAFILLILGKYEFITSTLKDPFQPQNLIVIIVFLAGCTVGLLSFSRVLNYMLQKFHNMTLAFLTGLMTGSMLKIWPWKEVLESRIIRGKEYVLSTRNILPESIDSAFFIALSLAVIGFICVLVLERLSRRGA